MLVLAGCMDRDVTVRFRAGLSLDATERQRTAKSAEKSYAHKPTPPPPAAR